MIDKFNKYKNMYKLNQEPFDQTQKVQNSIPVGNAVVVPQAQVIQQKAYNPFNTATMLVPQVGPTQTFLPVANSPQQVTQVFRSAPKHVVSTLVPSMQTTALVPGRRVVSQPIVDPSRIQYVPVPQTQQIVAPNQNRTPAIDNGYDPVKERYKKEIKSLTAELETLKAKTEQKIKVKTKFEIKMSKLDKLLRLHYITNAEYERKKKELIEQAINSI